ncbi:MAG: rod shape-determining protein RodA [Pseudomonadota bacterium]
MTAIQLPSGKRDLGDFIVRLHWPMIMALSMIAAAGVLTLYSVAGGSWTPWAMKHGLRFVAALGIMVGMSFVAVKYWMSLAYPVYFLALIALLLVPFIGAVNMGAQRWLEFGSMQIQPSELMKIGLVMGLARYYHGLRSEQVSNLIFLAPPLAMIAAPVGLVFIQPDLGTALLLAATGFSIVLIAGVSWRLTFVGGLFALLGAYGAYRFEILKPYQLERIFTFLDPDRDPLGQGYQLLQSKIGIGSGGLSGKGFMGGSQAQLKFLPEMQTDFIFIVFGEEFGFVGAMCLLGLYLAVILMGVAVAIRSRFHFARLTCMGVVVTFALYVLINTGMVTGLAPVVGVPLPLVSYGGTVMLTIMVGFGLVMSAHMSREQDTYGLVG